MRKFIVGLVALLCVTAVYATCTQTIIYSPDGKMLVCQNCCDTGGNCQIRCF